MAKKKSKKDKKVRNMIKARTIGYVTAGFALVAGLAWDDAIKSLIEFVFPIVRNTVLVKFIYAGAMTIIVVLISVYLIKIFNVAEKEK